MDIGLFIIDNCIQIKLDSGDLASDPTLETAVLISLFSDQRVTLEELPDGIEDQKGWWGDLFAENEGDQIGSKLWTLARAKASTGTLAAMETRAKEALKWMIDDGLAASVEVSAEYDDSKRALLAIVITRPAGDSNRFSVIWGEQEILRA